MRRGHVHEVAPVGGKESTAVRASASESASREIPRFLAGEAKSQVAQGAPSFYSHGLSPS